MTASDPRVGEIQARLDAATPGPWGNADDTYRSIPVHRIGSEVTGSDVAQVMLMGKQSAADAEFIAAAPSDVTYLLAELRDRDEKLAKVDGLSAEWDEYPSSPEGRCAAQLRAAVAAANGGES